MQKDTHRKSVQQPITQEGPIKPSAFPMLSSYKNKKTKNKSLSSANKPFSRKKFSFFKSHAHLLAAICSLIALGISYHLWKDETQWVVKWMIIYTAFALFYWSIKPVIRWILEKWNK